MANVRPPPKRSLEAYKHISPDSGFPITIHPNYNPKIANHVPPDKPLAEFTPPQDRGHFASADKKSLLSVATLADLTESIGRLLTPENIAPTELL
jgi:sulfonate dioxygenase